MKIGVLRFPGTNCDRDVFQAVHDMGHTPIFLWHGDHFNFKDFAALILPGGFSYGDYLRSGALAAHAVAMADVKAAAQAGTPVLGICNGFQILCEAGLLPGALVRNRAGRFQDRWVDLQLSTGGRKPIAVPGTKPDSHDQLNSGSKSVALRLPIAHADGRYVIDGSDLVKLHERGQVWMTYTEDVNGSVDRIAGVFNEQKNVAGLMPHPERALHEWMGGIDGRGFFIEGALWL